MSNPFSHAPPPEPEAAQLEPVTVTVTVGAPPEQAFLGWTDHIHLWWPLDEFSVSGEDAFLDFEGGELVETSSGDQMISWGSVTTSEPPSLLTFSWHPGAGALQASRVEVQFTEMTSAAGNSGPSGGRNTEPATTVDLIHSDWDNMADAAAQRAEWSGIWPKVLARYVRFMGGPA